MAAKEDTGIYDFVEDGTVFTYNRLAEDILNHLYFQFGVQKRQIPRFRCPENFYKEARTIRFVSRQCKVNQILYRSVLFGSFTKTNAVKEIGNDVKNLCQFFSEEFEALTDHIAKVMDPYTPIQKFHLSFAILAELTLFCILKDKPNVVRKTARTWIAFFENKLKKEFEAHGGVSAVFLRAEKQCFLDPFLYYFIASHCVPYTGQDLHDLYYKEINSSNILKEQVDTSVPGTSMSGLHLDVMADLIEKTIDEEEFNPLLDVPTHDRLGVPLHEEVLKQSFDPKVLAPQAEAASTDMSENAAKAISALSLKEERKKTRKLRPSKASILKHKRSVMNLDGSSLEHTKELEIKTCDTVLASHELVDLLPQVPEPHPSSPELLANLQPLPENATENYFLGARPKTGMSSKKQ